MHDQQGYLGNSEQFVRLSKLLFEANQGGWTDSYKQCDCPKRFFLKRLDLLHAIPPLVVVIT